MLPGRAWVNFIPVGGRGGLGFISRPLMPRRTKEEPGTLLPMATRPKRTPVQVLEKAPTPGREVDGGFAARQAGGLCSGHQRTGGRTRPAAPGDAANPVAQFEEYPLLPLGGRDQGSRGAEIGRSAA
jgi:hypothetical protein